jgi:two-component system response regulator PilR (NtrC family)
LALLMNYGYPGNVRELENILERTLALCSDTQIGKEELQLPNKAREIPQNTGSLPSIISDSKLPLQDFLDQLEKDSIVRALDQSRYNRTKAAKTLGITVRSLRYRMERLGLNEKS